MIVRKKFISKEIDGVFLIEYSMCIYIFYELNNYISNSMDSMCYSLKYFDVKNDKTFLSYLLNQLLFYFIFC